MPDVCSTRVLDLFATFSEITDEIARFKKVKSAFLSEPVTVSSIEKEHARVLKEKAQVEQAISGINSCELDSAGKKRALDPLQDELAMLTGNITSLVKTVSDMREQGITSFPKPPPSELQGVADDLNVSLNKITSLLNELSGCGFKTGKTFKRVKRTQKTMNENVKNALTGGLVGRISVLWTGKEVSTVLGKLAQELALQNKPANTVIPE